MAGEDQPRRGLVAVELAEEGLEDLAWLRPRPGAREVGAVAPVLVRPDEEHLHAGLPALLVQRHDVGLLDALGVDPLVRLHAGQRPDAVAERRGALELHRPAGVGHRRREAFLHPGRAAAEEQHGVLDQRAVVGLADQPDAGRAAALDLVQQARPRPALEHRVGAGAQQEGLLQLVQRPVDAAGRGERAEVAARVLPQAAMLLDLRKAMVAGDDDVREALVVAQQHVVARLQLLDQVLLEQQRLGLGLRGQEHHRRRGADHSPYARVGPDRLGIGRHPLPEVAGLADVEHVAAGVEHPIDPGPLVEAFQIVADHRMASALGRLPGAVLLEALRPLLSAILIRHVVGHG